MSPAGAPETPTTSVLCLTEDDTLRLGRALANVLREGDVVFAEGDLGAGKTCLIRGICSGLGYEGVVRSPSYTVVSRYEGRCGIYHIDLYRIPESSAELEDLSRQECFGDDAVALVEWGGKLRSWGVEPSVRMSLKVERGEGRRVNLFFESRESAARARAAGLL